MKRSDLLALSLAFASTSLGMLGLGYAGCSPSSDPSDPNLDYDAGRRDRDSVDLPNPVDANSDGPSGNCAVTPCVTKIAVGSQAACALLDDGSVHCWGDNQWAQLGIASAGLGDVRSQPQKLDALQSVSELAAGSSHFCALDGTGTIRCWGRNSQGQLGATANTDPNENPTTVSGIPDPIKAMVAGREHTCALTTTGNVHCWGSNRRGQLAVGSVVNGDAQPAATATASKVNIANVSKLFGADENTCVMLSPTDIRCAGANAYGQLGRGGADDPEPHTDLDTVVSLAGNVDMLSNGPSTVHLMAVLADGRLQGWGANLSGQLGISPDAAGESTTPVLADGVTGVKKVGTGTSVTCALDALGGVKCWGFNSRGQAGPGGTLRQDVPTAIALSGPAIEIQGGNEFCCALMATGAVECWGSNAKGQLGRGNGSPAEDPNPAPVKFP